MSLTETHGPEVSQDSTSLGAYPRIIGRARGDQPGPTLITVGAIHGNEPAGFHAIRRVVESLGSGARSRLRGEFAGITGNRSALALGERFVDEDLNRRWNGHRLEEVRRNPCRSSEDHERAEIAEAVDEICNERTPTYLLDLHTTSGPGPSFVVLEDRLANRALAFALPVPVVLGLEEEIEGTLTHYLSEKGLVAISFESGQHEEPKSIDRAEAAIWITLATVGCLPDDDERVISARALLSEAFDHLPAVVDVRYRHAITPDDEFRMLPGFVSFQRIRRGQHLANDRRGPILAPNDGLILMPLYQKKGEDGFFLIRRVSPRWLRVSAIARRISAERVVHALPGVRRDPDTPGQFIVDRRVARWLTLEVFHLLGFRRRRQTGDYLVMMRRHDD